MKNKQRSAKLARNRRNRERQRKAFFKLKEADQFKENAKSIQEGIEIKAIAPNGIFYIGENLYSKTYLVQDMNYVIKTYEEQVSFFASWCRILNSIDTHGYKITVFNKNKNVVEIRDSIFYQHQGDRYDDVRDCYNNIIENKIMDGRKGISQVKFLTLTVKRVTYEDAKMNFRSIESNLIKEFAALGSIVLSLDANERLEVLYNFNRIGSESEFDIDFKDYLASGRDWRNDIVCNYYNFTESPDYFRTDRKYGKCICIDPKSYPVDDINDELFDSLININKKGVFTIDVVPIPKAATKNELENKYMSTQEKIRKQQRRRNENHDFSSEISYSVTKQNEEIKEMMDDVRDNGQKMSWVSIEMVLVADTLDELDASIDSLNMIIENSGCYSNDFMYKQQEALNSILPVGGRYITNMRNMFTRMLGIFIPFKTMEMQDYHKPIYYGINKESKETILCNRKNLPNGNGFCFGSSGFGKSFFMKLEQLSVFLNTEDDIIILDPSPEREYYNMCPAFGGEWIEISSQAENYLNPLHVDVKSITRKNVKKIIAQKSNVICGIVEHAMDKDFNSNHRSIVDRCVKELFTKIVNQSIEERTVPILSDFMTCLKEQKEKEAADIMLSMEIFTDGSLDIFNNQTTVDPDNRIVVYGIGDIDSELESVAMLIVLENIKQKIISNYKRGIATWLYADEFHVVMGKPFSRKFFISLWKMVRKAGGICTGITQNLSDVVSDKESKKLISNSEFTTFLHMGPGDDEAILDVFKGKISKEHIKYIDNAVPGTGLIRFGNIVIPLDDRIEKSNPIYDVFNTNFYEKAAQKMEKKSKIK